MAKALLGDGSRLAKVDRLIAAVEQPGLVDPQRLNCGRRLEAAKLTCSVMTDAERRDGSQYGCSDARRIRTFNRYRATFTKSLYAGPSSTSRFRRGRGRAQQDTDCSGVIAQAVSIWGGRRANRHRLCRIELGHRRQNFGKTGADWNRSSATGDSLLPPRSAVCGGQ